MSSYTLILILLLSPLAGALFNGVRFRSSNGVLAGAVSSIAVVLFFFCFVVFFF